MSLLLFVWGLMAAAFGFAVLALSRSGFAEIEAGLSFLIATVAMGCAAIIYQLKKNANQQAAQSSNSTGKE